MTRYFLHLAYRGARYHGWQVQPGDVTVQECIEKAFATILRRTVSITGAGRTDAGVNASMMIAHLDLDDHEAVRPGLLRGLNSLLAPDIVLYSLTKVHEDAHARFDATEREYHYHVTTRRSPFAYPLSMYVGDNVDFDAMNRAGLMLLGRRDFTSFSKLHTDVKTNICDLREACWYQDPSDPFHWTFVIRADRFLRNMVRAVVGTLLAVGRGKMAPEAVVDILEAADRCAAGDSVPAHPLFLAKIKYPYYSE